MSRRPFSGTPEEVACKKENAVLHYTAGSAQWAADALTEKAEGKISEQAAKDRLGHVYQQLDEQVSNYDNKPEITAIMQIVKAAIKDGTLPKEQIAALAAFAQKNEAAYGQAVNSCVKERSR